MVKSIPSIKRFGLKLSFINSIELTNDEIPSKAKNSDWRGIIIDWEATNALIVKSPSHISNLIRILELDEEIHKMIIEGKISMGHARALIGVPNPIEKAKEIFEKKLSVRDVEKLTSAHKKVRAKKNGERP